MPFVLAGLGVRALWRWHKRRKTPAAAPAPQNTIPRQARAAPAATTVPRAVPRGGQHTRSIQARDIHGGPNIMNHIDAAAEAATQHIGSWEPEDASDLDLFLASLPSYFEAVSGAFTSVAERLADGYPVDPSVPERLREIASTVGGMADFSGEAHAAHRAQHERELERIENPRRGEEFWDVTRQG